VAPNIFSIITAVVHLYVRIRSRVPQQRAPDNSKYHGSLQNFGSSVLNLMHVALNGAYNLKVASRGLGNLRTRGSDIKCLVNFVSLLAEKKVII
jgi:hypothetical protein